MSCHRYIRFAFLLGAAFLLWHPQAWPADPTPVSNSPFQWDVIGGDAPFRLVRQEFVQASTTQDQSSERITLDANQGATLYVQRAITPLKVIEELRPSVVVSANRAGVQLLARVALPRERDPRTGHALHCMVRGDAYDHPGNWQQLVVEDLPRLLAREAWLLRYKLGRDVDVREAYVDALVVNAYSGPGRTELWIGEVDAAGAVEASAVTPVAFSEPSQGTGSSNDEASTAGRVRTRGPVLLVDNRPFFPRMIEYQGESLRFLAERGFNTIRLATPPTAALAAEAAALGMWIVCPPPALAADAADPTVAFSEDFASVLAWDLGHDLTTGDLERTRQLAEQVRRADRFRGRPLICSPAADLRSYSRLAHGIVAARAPLGASLELTDYGAWLRERTRLTRPGTPIWVDVQTQFDVKLLRQQSLFTGRDLQRAAVEPDQIRLATYQAISAGARSICFRSNTPLDYADAATRRRARALELLNLELELVEPWAAAGQFGAIAGGGNSEMSATVLQAETARLLVPVWCGPGAQFVPGQAAGNDVSFIVPGVPASHEPYELTPGGLRALRRQRVTGGVRVTLDEFGLTSLVVITADPRVLGALRDRTQRSAAQAARLARDLAAEKFTLVDQIDRTLSVNVESLPQAEDWRAAARQLLDQAELRLNAGDYQSSYLMSQRAGRAMRLIERAHWERAATKLGAPVAGPLAVGFATLPEHWRMLAALRGVQPGMNLLVGGNFENLPAMVASGWEHVEHAEEGVKSSVDLVPQSARSGKLGLRLRVVAADPQQPPGMIESPPVWITSPQLSVSPGTWVRVRGWVKIPRPIAGSVDGLQVSDSLGGAALSERIGTTKGWREFNLYRVADQSGGVSVTFALSGLGEAWIDDVAVEPLAVGAQPTSAPTTTGSRTYAPSRR